MLNYIDAFLTIDSQQKVLWLSNDCFSLAICHHKAAGLVVLLG